MAQVRDIQLEMGQLQDQQAYADLRFTVEFSDAELRRNLQYGLYAGLFYHDSRSLNAEFESNGAYQTYMMPATPPFGFGQVAYSNPGMEPAFTPASGMGMGFMGPQGPAGWQPQDASGFICWICREALQPAGTRTHHIERRVAFDFTRMPQRNADYRGMVWALPEITEGQAFSRPSGLGMNSFQRFQTQPLY
ncbi:MAG: hypothetical protein SFY70_08790 [Bacteroidia bacterium]|nr:hypothetical protein [Bacteroidia bacterium]